MQQIRTGLDKEQRSGITDRLHALLADEHVLYIKTRRHHWNVTGPHFGVLHPFLETQYEELARIIDELAERSLQLGVRAPGSMAAFLKLTRLSESDREPLSECERLTELLADQEAIIRQLRADSAEVDEAFEDMGTSDFLTGLMEKHEKMAWMIRAHLDGQPRPERDEK